MALDAVLDALGDPTRREILDVLRSGELAVGDLADRLPVSRPAVSQHLRVLEGAGLARGRREGRRHLYAVDHAGLVALRAYIELFWDTALASYKQAADAAGKERS
jgi:DNA-binding transcriptional ArsR family regulator